MMAELNQGPKPNEPVAMSGDDRGISVGRDASGNAFVTGDHNQVRVVIYQQVLREQQPAPPAATKLGPNPYMGLLAFHEEDAARFFGRETQITRLWERLRDLQVPPRPGEYKPRMLPVLGPSGSGKSSVVRAGLIPELARRPLPGWRDVRVAVLKPGTRPVEELARVLARIATGDATPVQKTAEFETVLKTKGDSGICDGLRRIADALPQIADVPLLVLVDQFEELYSLCTDVTARTVFIENLLHAASDATGRVSVVITLRTDFLGETQSHLPLNRLICEQQVLIPAMSEAELRAAIAQPAALAGHSLDDATVTLLIEDSKDRIGALPLLQFALLRIWDGLTRGVPPAQTYEQIGGVGGALAGEAQRIFEQLENESDQRIAKRVFLGLVQLGEGTRDTRRRALIQNLVAVGEQLGDVERVINRFAGRDARLITLSADEHGRGDTAEITHEALFDHWKELNTWLDENRDDIRLNRRLEEAARLWDEQGRPEGDLWRPPTLGLLREYHRRAEREMSPLQMEFFRASAKAEDDRERAARRRRRHLLTLTFSLGLTTILAVVFWVTSLRVGWNAQRGQIDALTSAILLSPPRTAGEQIKGMEKAAPSGRLRNYAIERLVQIADAPLPTEASDEEKKTLASNKANVLAALLKFGDSPRTLETIRSNLEKSQCDPTLRSYATHRFNEAGVDPNILLGQLEQAAERPVVLATLLLSLGKYDVKDVSEANRELFLRKIEEIYRTNKDPGVHGAAEWLLRRWNKDSEIKKLVEGLKKDRRELSTTNLPRERGWYVTRYGQTMVYFRGPVKFQMGSPTTQADRLFNETPHDVTFMESFAIADKEVTWESFGEFLQCSEYTKMLDPGELRDVEATEFKVQKSWPVYDVSWYVAAAYCNWLTEQESGEDERCYKPNRAGKYAAGMDLEHDFRRRRGYRLPTESEWEYACRAGASTRWSHGEAEELLTSFAQHGQSRKTAQPPQVRTGGLLMPNGFGLFDMHGNVWEWCQDWYLDTYPADGEPDPTGPQVGSSRVYRGGSWSSTAWYTRSASRGYLSPSVRGVDLGFRVAAVPFSSVSPLSAVAPFNEADAKQYQQAWAKYLSEPVEKETTLPGGEKLLMVLIPPGDFVRVEGGQPFRVRLTKPFYLGKYEVTQAQWQSVMGSNPSHSKYAPTLPVEQVSWDDIQPFLAKLNSGGSGGAWRFDLPMEAQWEYACRAGMTTAYSFGDSEADLGANGWFLDNAFDGPHLAGQRKSNPFGLCDMHGNVWEWCVDWLEVGYYANAPRNDPPGPSRGSSRVYRGGGWDSPSWGCRSAYRRGDTPDFRRNSLGFRVAAVPSSPVTPVESAKK